MQYIDLVEKLSIEDKKKISDYIYTFGVKPEYFMGLENWLQDWNCSKQKMYKLLGNNFILSYPIEFEKDIHNIDIEIANQLLTMPFFHSYREFCSSIISDLFEKNIISSEIYNAFCSLRYSSTLADNKINSTIKLKLENKKLLQIQAGSRPMKALAKIVDYFKDMFTFVDFEEARIKHSIILTDKHYKGKLYISIHPLDFMTMSDNNSNWTSCMSWRQTGCYCVGTIETMNSNNTLCCYLVNDKDFEFGEKNHHNSWNNKIYRSLVYITKDIIMSGKSYPYRSDDLSKIIIEKVKELAKKNLNWHYQYGPEVYQDMKYINSLYSMDRARSYMKYNPVKKNILWDTKGMYNDMLNDKYTKYWCYRNKVKHTKIMSVSGKSTCLCCGGSIIEYDDWAEEYNERYDNVGSLVCSSCSDKYRQVCNCCYTTSFSKDYIPIHINDNSNEGCLMNLCPDCAERYLKKCPCCGKPLCINSSNRLSYYIYGCVNAKEFLQDYYYKIDGCIYNTDIIIKTIEATKVQHPTYEDRKVIESIYVCKDCLDKGLLKNAIKIPVKNKYISDSEPVDYYIFELDEVEKYRYCNLEPAPADTYEFYL